MSVPVFLLLAANLLTSSRARMCCHAATPLSVFPAQRSISSGSVCSARYRADSASECRDADRHPPAVCGSGASVVEVHLRGTCCWMRPFSNQSRSRRPWSDFLRGSSTFCLGMPAAAGGEGPVFPQGGSLFGPQSVDGSAVPGIIVRRQKQSAIKRDRNQNRDSDCRLTNRGERSLRSGMRPVGCSMSACVHVRRERASYALSRNSAGSMLPSLMVGDLENTG